MAERLELFIGKAATINLPYAPSLPIFGSSQKLGYRNQTLSHFSSYTTSVANQGELLSVKLVYNSWL